MGPAPLSYRGVVVRYGAVRALDGLELAIAAARVTALVGPNGAGKTTSLRLAVGLAHCVQGSVRVFGHDPVADPVKARKMLGFLPDRPTLPEHLTVAELLQLRAGLWGHTDRRRIERRTTELLGTLGIEGFEKRRCQALSHGQAQRVSLAAVLITEPRLLLVDEPMTALDLEGQVTVRTVLRQVADRGTAVVVTTHTVAHVAALADEIVRLDSGRLGGRRAGTRDANELEQWLLEPSS